MIFFVDISNLTYPGTTNPRFVTSILLEHSEVGIRSDQLVSCCGGWSSWSLEKVTQLGASGAPYWPWTERI